MMKKFAIVFLVVLIALGISNVLQGFLLTYFYVPDLYVTSNHEIHILIQYSFSAIIITLLLLGIDRLKSFLRRTKSL